MSRKFNSLSFPSETIWSIPWWYLLMRWMFWASYLKKGYEWKSNSYGLVEKLYFGILFQTNLRNADRLREMSRIYKTKGKLASFNEMTDILHQLWQDKGIQRCYERSNEFHLIDSAQYFLSKVYDLVQQKSFYFVETILINSIFRSTTLWLRDTIQAQMTFCERGS